MDLGGPGDMSAAQRRDLLLAASASGIHESAGIVLCDRDYGHGGGGLHGAGRQPAGAVRKMAGILGSRQFLFFRCVCGPRSLFKAGIFKPPDRPAAVLLRTVSVGLFCRVYAIIQHSDGYFLLKVRSETPSQLKCVDRRGRAIADPALEF